jgi:glycosyltransferase involved in cell wall biosynthesis
MSCERELREFVKQNYLEETVLFTGYTQDVVSYLTAADFFVIASESESLCLSLIEAMSCRLPSIATATGGIVDYLKDGDNGLLIPVGDETALLNAMSYLVENEHTLGGMADTARQTVAERFGILSIANQHQTLFNSLHMTFSSESES